MENNSQLTSFIIQSINGIETIKAYNLEKNIQDETEFKYLKVIKSSFKRSKIYNLLTFLSGVVELIGNTLIMWVGAIQVINGKLTLGEMMVFNTLLGYFTNPVKNLISLQPTIQTATVSADRLGEIIDLDIEQSDEKMIPQNLKGDIEIKGLNFRYGTRELILKNINNFNLKDIDNTFLRNKISYISQDMFLFNKTIKENLMLSDEIEIDDVIELSKKVNAYEFRNELPQRFDYMIEENGTNLSTGQKQKLSILRALLKKPDILIMDEATSNLDSITESAIQKTLNNPEFNMTTIIIAHRLSTIRLCDRIYVLDKGEIIEAGTHEELIELKNKYYALWKEQENIHEN